LFGMTDHAGVQKLLQDDLLQLYKNLAQLEKKSHELEIQEKRVVERHAKRTQEHDQREGSAKRLKSAVVVKNIDETQTEAEPAVPRPAIKATESDRGRNRRLLGNLLLGTLAKFKEEQKATDENVAKRSMIEKEIEDKVEKDQESLVKKEMDTIVGSRTDVSNELTQTRASIEAKERELKETILREHSSYLEYYATTKTQPLVYFRPAKLDEWSSGAFGFKIPPADEEQVQTVSALDQELL